MPDTVRDPPATAQVLTAGHIGLMVTSRVDPPQAARLARRSPPTSRSGRA